MELEEQLTDFAGRIQSGCGPYVSYDEVQQWPKGRLEELLDMGVLIKTTPAKEINCTECSGMDCPPIEPSIETFPGASEPDGAFLCKKEGGGGLIRIPLKRMKRWEIVVEKLKDLGFMDVEVEEQAETSGQPGANVKGMSWQDAQKKAEALVDKKGYLGFGVLAKAVGCSGGTLRKVITEKSPKLQKAKSEYESTSATLKAVGLTAKIAATYEASAEPMPTDDEAEELLAEMLERIRVDQPDMLEPTKQQIDEMNPEGKQRLAASYQKYYQKQKNALKKKGVRKQKQYKQV